MARPASCVAAEGGGGGDCGSRLLLDPPPSPPVFPPPPPPTPLPPGVGVEATSDSVATQDAGPGLAIGLALGGCLLVTGLVTAIFVWYRKRRMQPPPSSAPTTAPQQVEVTVTMPQQVTVTVTMPESKKAARRSAKESLIALSPESSSAMYSY